MLERPARVRVVGRVVTGNSLGCELLETQQMKALRFFDPADMVVGVEAGLGFEELCSLLGEQSMQLPLNAWFPNATLGSMVAANSFGPDRMFGGGVRDSIIGIEYVNGLGKLVKAGGKVVKNVTGYDVSRMMIGSRGGLGCITAVNFKLIPQTKNPAVMRFESPDLAQLGTLQAIVADRQPLDWCQLRWQNGCWQMAFGISGNRPRLMALRQRLAAFLAAGWRFSDEAELSPEWLWARQENRKCGFLKDVVSLFSTPYGHLHLQAPTSHWTASRLHALARPGRILVVHPFGGDAHLFIPPQEDLSGLQQELSAWATLEWIAVPAHSVGIYPGLVVPLPPAYEFIQHLKAQLDPGDIFVAPFYQIGNSPNRPREIT